MTKTKGLRKAKHGKRHSRKVHHGGENEEQRETKIMELKSQVNEIKNLSTLEKYYDIKFNNYLYSDKTKLADIKPKVEAIHPAYLNYNKKSLKEEIDFMKIQVKSMGESNVEKLEDTLRKLESTCPTTVRVGMYTKGNENNFVEAYDFTGNNPSDIKRVGNKCIADGEGTIEKKGKKVEVTAEDGRIPMIEPPQKDTYFETLKKEYKIGDKPDWEKIYRLYLFQSKSIPIELSENVSLEDQKKIEEDVNRRKNLKYNSKGGKKKRSKKTQRKRKRKHRASSRR